MAERPVPAPLTIPGQGQTMARGLTGKGFSMIANIYRSTPAALIFLGFAGTAQADVTAQQVWDDWRAYLSGTGYSVTADESMSGGTLTVTNVAMSMAMPEGAGDMVVTFGEIKFTEAGDGTVTVTIPTS